MKCFLIFGHKWSGWSLTEGWQLGSGYYWNMVRTCEKCGSLQHKPK